MDYDIIKYNNGHRYEGSTTWKNHPLEAVKEHVRELIDMGLADRVEVKDTSGQVVFQWPRTVRKP